MDLSQVPADRPSKEQLALVFAIGRRRQVFPLVEMLPVGIHNPSDILDSVAAQSQPRR